MSSPRDDDDYQQIIKQYRGDGPHTSNFTDTNHHTACTHTNNNNLLIAVRTDSSGFVVFATVVVRTIIEGAVPFAHRPTTSLVHEVPVEADERTMLVAFVLQKRLALLHAELLQVSASAGHVVKENVYTICVLYCVARATDTAHVVVYDAVTVFCGWRRLAKTHTGPPHLGPVSGRGDILLNNLRVMVGLLGLRCQQEYRIGCHFACAAALGDCVVSDAFVPSVYLSVYSSVVYMRSHWRSCVCFL